MYVPQGHGFGVTVVICVVGIELVCLCRKINTLLQPGLVSRMLAKLAVFLHDTDLVLFLCFVCFLFFGT